MTRRDTSLEGLAAWIPALRPRWAVGVVRPTGPVAERVRWLLPWWVHAKRAMGETTCDSDSCPICTDVPR